MTDTSSLDSPRTTGAVAAGLATLTEDGTVLDTWFPAPRSPPSPDRPAPSG